MSLLKMALSVAVLSLVSCSSPRGSWLGKVKGRADARKDLQAGKLRMETMGPPPAPWEGTYKRLLKERFSIEYTWVAGCVVSNRVMGHADGYNEIMQAEIDRRFGKDALSKTADEARRLSPPPKF